MTLQKQILIVDDDPVNRAALRTILTPEYPSECSASKASATAGASG